ncbi:hypothetical protein D3P07_00580 [Paenibacillus sp. 1011MAR3C5]|uniref:DNA sulfur modification protein DndB n=1 Tax=Paenibacillus sp. 1011MAR3C5 TaxID=1675787 RepID=UPI000E6D2678|nr:DNA sulfur modification protein DndB [Paenibacillus sp. 1011MAR3C5]RJE90639.1 hypothetical protein D3P07_00580 [Paenibacillus sp. 1011MAR3C5]
MMKTEEKNIYEVLSEELSSIAKHRNQQRMIEEYLVEHHEMMRGTFIELVANPEKVGFLSTEELAVITNGIHTVTQNETLFVKNYFDLNTIKAIKYFAFSKPEEIAFPYTFSPVIRVTNEDYLTAISFKDLAALANSGLLTYNFDTQRLAKKTISKTGKIIKKRNIKNASVSNIVKLMKEGKYNPSTLLFNVLVDGNSSISFNSGELTIHKESTLNIIDGAHRLEAVIRIIEEDPEFEGYMNIDLKHYPLEKAQKLLAITNTVNPFDKTLTKYYGGEQYGQEIAKYLMTIPVLHNRIEIKTAVDKKISITNFAILSEAIQDIFEPENTKDRYDIQDVLKKFYEYLIPSYESELVKNRIKNLESSWISHHNMHVGFIAIAKKLYDRYGKDFPVDKIVAVIDHINFNKVSSPLNDIMGGQGKTNSNKVKSQIREFIESQVDNILD